MALRNLVFYDDPFLRKKSREVTEVNDRIRQQLDDMAETMYADSGAGLAGCQVGILKRIIVIDMGQGLIKLVNPKIIESSGTQEVVEGCLSIPDRWGKLMRPQKVTVEALNENGEKIVLTGENDLAKCFCHEIDHLDGILFIDKVTEFIDINKKEE